MHTKLTAEMSLFVIMTILGKQIWVSIELTLNRHVKVCYDMLPSFFSSLHTLESFSFGLVDGQVPIPLDLILLNGESKTYTNCSLATRD